MLFNSIKYIANQRRFHKDPTVSQGREADHSRPVSTELKSSGAISLFTHAF
jgi:hypothetical protein